MAHGIMEFDSGFSANGIRPWHNLPQMKVLKDGEYSTVVSALHEASLDWNVVQAPLYTDINGKKVVIPNQFANIIEEKGLVLGQVSKKYKIVQNVEALDFVNEIMNNGKNIRFESAGSLFNNKKIWLLARMDDRKVLGDDYETYLCFSNGFDGKSPVRVCVTNIRVECANLLQLAEKSSMRMWTTKHCGDIASKKREAIDTLGLVDAYLHSFEKRAEELTKIKMDFDKFIDLVMPIDENATDRIKSNTTYVRDTIKNIYVNKDDLQNFRGTGFGLYNAVADYYSNYPSLRNAPTVNDYRMEQSMMSEIPMLKKAEEVLFA